MSLFFAELRKVWGGRVFPALLAILAASNLLLLWMGTRPTAKQPPASAYRAVGAELSDKTMEEKGAYLHNKYTEIESLVKIGQYYRELAYGGYGLTQYRQDNAAMFDAYEQEYTDKTYTLFTDNLNTEYRLFSQLQSEYDTVAAYNDFLDGVQTKAAQLSGISIFQNDRTGYDLKNIELTAQVYAGLTDTPIEYYPQKGLYTAISYAFTDLILLAAMLLLALILVRQERDSGLLSLIRSLPGGRLKTAIAKLAAFAASLLVVLMVLYGVNLAYCSASFSLGPMNRTIQSVPALMRCTMQITVGQYLLRFLLAKWAGAFVMGLWVMLAALIAKRAAAGWVGALALPLAMYGIRTAIPATSHLNVIKYANMVSLLQTNELLGNYRNLFWFGNPVSLPLVEWLTAAVFGGSLFVAFCTVFAKAQLLPAAKHSFALPFSRKTRATSVTHEEGRKLLLMNGAAVFLAAFLVFGIYQGVTAESYIDADEIYYAYYMKHISGPWSEESRDWMYEIFIWTAIGLVLLNLVWQLYRCYGAGFDIDTENPINLVVRSVIFLLLIWYCDDIVNLALQIGGTPYTWILDSSLPGVQFGDFNSVLLIIIGVIANGSVALIALILVVILAWNYLKLLLEAAERYVVLGILVFTAPLAFAMGAARGTNNIFKSWCRMFSGQLLLLIMNAWCLKLFVNMVGEFLANPLSL